MEEELTEESRIQTFQEAGLLTRDKGLVIRLPDGNEFQITVIQSKFCRRMSKMAGKNQAVQKSQGGERGNEG